MNMMRQELIAVGCLVLAITGCERNSHDASDSQEPPSARPSEFIAPVLKPELIEDQPQAESFPITPDTPAVLAAIPTVSLANLDDASLSETFLSSSGATWNEALREMKKRQTPALVAVLAGNLDVTKGAAVVSGEAFYAPELRYPVVRVLMEIGEKPIADLIVVCTSPNFSLKKRVLAARVLRQLEAGGQDAASVERIRSTLSSSAELAAFDELWAVADDDSRVAAVLGDQ